MTTAADHDALVVSKASLVTLSHAFEEACLQEPDPRRLVVACFQEGRHLDVERERYDRIARNSGLTVVLHADEPARHETAYHEVRIPPGHRLLTAWDVVLVSPGSAASLVCEDLGVLLGAEDGEEPDRAFAATWVFDRAGAAADARDVLADVELPRGVRDRADELLAAATAEPVSEEERQLGVAFDHLVRSLETAHLRARSAAGEARRARLLAERDELTGAFNRTFLGSYGRRRGDGPVAAVLLDLDRFKHVNDTFGHSAGDRVLAAVGTELRSNVRATDVVVRWGGDEFLVLLPDVDAGTAQRHAARLVERLAEIRFEPPLEDYRVGASAGVGVLDGPGLDIEAVDRALYDAKRAGGGVAKGG